MKRHWKTPEQPDDLNRIWFLGFPDLKSLVATGFPKTPGDEKLDFSHLAV
jgi:hypothetical protein